MQRKLNLFATQRLIELFSNIEHQISYSFNESIRYRNSFPVSYLDFGSTNDSVSFITRNKYDDIQKTNPNEWASLVWKEKRSEMKIGKLIRMFFGDNFPVNHPKGEPRPKPMVDIESFVNKFKAERDKDVNYNRFEIISGDDFHYWYSQDNYSRFVHEETTLGRSCLRYNESTKYLNIYSKNPEIFSMLILKDDAGKLRGRANIWKLEKPEGRIYMDRVYSVNDFDVELFKDYAKENKWLHKEAQTYGWHNNIVDTTTGNIYKWDEMVMLATIEKVPGRNYKYYPYLDTLSVYNTQEHTLTNDGRLRVLEPHILLTDYQGSYNSEVDGRDRVYSSIYNEYIVREESKFVEIDDTWVYENDAVYVHNSGGKYAYRNSDKIVESYIYKKKWFMKEDTVFSDYLGTYIHKESVRDAYLDSNKSDESVKIHYRMIGREFEEKDGIIIKKKDSTNQRKSTKRSIGDNRAFEEVLRNLHGDGSPRSRSTRNIVDELFTFEESVVNTPTVDTPTVDTPTVDTPTVDTPTVDSTEEDSDLLSGVNLDNYDAGLREYLYERLERYRRERTGLNSALYGNAISDDLEPSCIRSTQHPIDNFITGGNGQGDHFLRDIETPRRVRQTRPELQPDQPVEDTPNVEGNNQNEANYITFRTRETNNDNDDVSELTNNVTDSSLSWLAQWDQISGRYIQTPRQNEFYRQFYNSPIMPESVDPSQIDPSDEDE